MKSKRTPMYSSKAVLVRIMRKNQAILQKSVTTQNSDLFTPKLWKLTRHL